jgi:hypothetical protein
MKVTGSLLWSIGRILFKKGYFLNIDINDLLAILKKGFRKKSKRRAPTKRKDRDEMSDAEKMGKDSKDSLERPRFIA